MRSDQKFRILFNRGFICTPIYYKKEIIFVGNIYFRIHLKVYLLSNQKLFLLYVNSITENLFLYVELTIFFTWTRGFIPNCAHLFQCSLFVLFIVFQSPYDTSLILWGTNIFYSWRGYFYGDVRIFIPSSTTISFVRKKKNTDKQRNKRKFENRSSRQAGGRGALIFFVSGADIYSRCPKIYPQ